MQDMFFLYMIGINKLRVHCFAFLFFSMPHLAAYYTPPVLFLATGTLSKFSRSKTYDGLLKTKNLMTCLFFLVFLLLLQLVVLLLSASVPLVRREMRECVHKICQKKGHRAADTLIFPLRCHSLFTACCCQTEHLARRHRPNLRRPLCDGSHFWTRTGHFWGVLCFGLHFFFAIATI